MGRQAEGADAELRARQIGAGAWACLAGGAEQPAGRVEHVRGEGRPGPVIQRGKDLVRELPGCGYRSIDIHVILPERVHLGVLTARRAGDTVTALWFRR